MDGSYYRFKERKSVDVTNLNVEKRKISRELKGLIKEGYNNFTCTVNEEYQRLIMEEIIKIRNTNHEIIFNLIIENNYDYDVTGERKRELDFLMSQASGVGYI